jgi:outer membrane receptor for ferrienterochelin and colicins
MHRVLLLLPFLGIVQPVFSQNTLHAVVRDEHSGLPLIGVSAVVENTTIGSTSDVNGLVTIAGIPNGTHTVVFSYVGYQPRNETYTFPLTDPDTLIEIRLEEAEIGLEGVTVSATRTSRTIADIPIRVETIAGEEIDEKISMEPSNISMLLNESPGIMVQQTSPISGNSTIRIQGLDGRYTQILKDGFPLYGGFSGGLSIMQIPPLDLQQVEVIKGPSSTLYGGDAIAGIINLVSKTPAEEGEWSFILNGTSAGGFDAGGFYAKRGERFGISVLGSANLQRPFDADDDLFTNLPKTRRFSLAPKLFHYGSEGSSLVAGISGTVEDREGGDIDVVRDEAAGPDAVFFEHNYSQRFTSQIGYDNPVGESGRLTLKNSLSYFNREIEVPEHRFAGYQIASYSEASYLFRSRGHDLVLGVDLRTDLFEEDEQDTLSRDYDYRSVGVFAQDTWDVSDQLVIESGIRTDVHNKFGVFVLPKLSVLYRFTDTFSGRVGGGLGYKAPTVFLGESEERAFQGVLPLDDDIDAETSVGGSLDLNYQALLFDRLALSFNQAFYWTNLNDPLVPLTLDDDPDLLLYGNSEGGIRTRGLETNMKFELGDFKLFLGYVYLDAKADHNTPDRHLLLTPTHKTYTVLVFERHEEGRLGIEAYYTGPQHLSDGSDSPGYWVTGIMGERWFGNLSIFLNLENFLDTQQSRYEPIVLGPRSNPTFTEVWGPTDGFIANGGIKYSF